MRAHFAIDVPASIETDDGLQENSPNTKEPQPKVAGNEANDLLEDRILEFKSDSSKMAVVGEFIDDVLQKAEEEANKQQKDDNNKNSQQGKNKAQKQNLKNGKVVNRARGFVVKLFESICNCANNAATAPVTRFKLRSGKRTSTSAEVTENNGRVESAKKEEKSKKNNNGGKKNDKIQIDNAGEVQEAIELQ